MIIVRLSGGLGNQMFQYAVGRQVADRHKTIAKLDVSNFEIYQYRHYSLHCFHICEYIATRAEVESLYRESKLLTNLFARKIMGRFGIERRYFFRSPFLVEEKSLSFDATPLQRNGDMYLMGYWQSEKYFYKIRELLLCEFEVKYKQDRHSREISDVIQSTNSISLHVRRADYVQNPHYNKIYGTCDQDYYSRAIQHIVERVSSPHFFLFSDDPDWVKRELKLEFPATVIEHNGPERSYEDLRLMSQCQHNIIANSSFSWWGAWLNQNPHKIVVAPTRWFADEARNAQAGDIVPEAWIKL
jgi:hypothetical protein